LKLPDSGRRIVKNLLRRELAEEFGDPERLKDESDMAWSFLNDPNTIKALDGVFRRLSKSKM
jgi:hypothetical protein